MTLSRPSACGIWLAAVLAATGSLAAPPTGRCETTDEWSPAIDEARVSRRGTWSVSRFRYAAASSLATFEDRASVELSFEGTGIAVRLGSQNVPAYGPPNLGRLAVFVDGKFARGIRPLGTPRELVLAEGLEAGTHKVRVVHRTDGERAGCRIEGFRSWSEPRGHLNFRLSGEQNAFLVDARAVLKRNDAIERNVLVRNWLTGQCSLAGLPPGEGYVLELSASGWEPVRVEGITITAGKVSWRPPVYLQRSPETVIRRFRFPRLNRQAIRRPGGTFRARFLGFDTTIDSIRLSRRVGPAVVSREVSFEEDVAAKYYYDREVVVTLPDDMPPGLYDLAVTITGGRRTGVCRSPRSVHVVTEFPAEPVLATFGHLDTSAQYQAEYLGRLAEMINLVGADLVLVSNAVNPAYVSGSLARLQVPHVINFGNHQFPGHEAWYGDPVGLVDFGPGLCVLNHGHPWHEGTARADRLLGSRPQAGMKIINAFEANAPVAFLDRHKVCMIHDAHGTGVKVMDIGRTPTRRIGKTSAVSFRIVRFQDNRVVSCTYNGHETAPIPFGREEAPPVSITFARTNDGSHAGNTATITNRLEDPFPNGRVTFVLPAGEYLAEGGRIESGTPGDDGRFAILVVRADIPAKAAVRVIVRPR